MSSLSVEEHQKWVPTHVQVTVLRGRGLRGKGKHGTSDVYAIIQLGKEKYSTCVAEKTTEPEWKEECTFELPPGALESGAPAGSDELVLTAMHRALIGLDVFLGQAVVPLDKVFRESRYVRNEWYRLNSKTGKKEKERGDIQVTIQFTRNNLTASMYDLVMKDKGASTFGKLKERMRGKRRSIDEDSSSGVLPGGYGSLSRMRQRLPSDGGGEEDYEDDEGGEVRRSKMRTFFLRGKLRKSSDTRSCTSLGSESSESSSRGGSLSPTAGISVVVSDLSNSPSNSSNLTADNSPDHTAETSDKSSSSLKCEFGDEAGEITIAVPQRTVCVNGSHAYIVQPLGPGSGKPTSSLGLGPLQKSLPLSVSLQNLSPRSSTDLLKGPIGDGRRWSFDKPDEEERAAIAAALEQSGPMLGEEEEEEENLGQVPPKEVESHIQGKKQRRNLFSHGRNESAGKGRSPCKDESEPVHAAAEEKQKGWFGSKDSHSKPSLVVSPKLEPCTHPHRPPLPPCHHPSAPPVEPASLLSPLHHSNPFFHSQSTTPPISPCNPFFSLLQHNPFYEDMLMASQLKPSPSLPYLSSARPPVASLFPQTSNSNSTQTHGNPTTACSITGTDVKKELMDNVEKRPLPPAPTVGGMTLIKRSSNPFMSPGELVPNSEWDESFDAFAADRLQSREEQTAVCQTQQSIHPEIPCKTKDAALLTGADQNTSVSDAPHREAAPEAGFKAQKATGQLINTSAYHFDNFTQFLETIPEHASFETDNLSLNTPTNSEKLAGYAATNQINSTTNTNNLTDSNMHQALGHTSSVKCDNSSSDPSSSGLGSSAEEDILSSLSYSDKFSASSSEEAEAQNFESNVLSFENSSGPAVVKMPSESEDDITIKSNDLSLDFLEQDTVIQHSDGDEMVDVKIFGGSSAAQPSVLTHPEPMMVASGETQEHSEQKPKPKICSQPEDENGKKGTVELKVPEEDFSKVLNDLPKSVSSATDVMTVTTPDVSPSLHIITSSPDVRPSLLDVPVKAFGGPDASRHSPIPFGDFSDFLNASHIANSPSQGFDGTLLHAQVSNQSTSSFLQSFYVSVDSQDYQTCDSHPSSKSSSGSEPSETLHSTLCGELSEILSTAGAAPDHNYQPCSEETNHTDRMEDFVCGVEANTATLEASFMIGDDFGLEDLPTASTKPVVFQDEFSKCPQTPGATLQRSQSEGTLGLAFDELLLPSFGSDPGAIQEDLPSSQPAPDLPSLTPFAPSLTPDSSSSPVALCSLFPLVDTTARSPPTVAEAALPKPVPQETQQEQAANQQSSPHPVRPLTTAMLAEEKRTEGRSVLATGLEKLKSTIHPGRSSQLSEQDAVKKKCAREGAGSYYHLNQGELVALLVQREAELERQKEAFERQKCLLAKREVELKRLKPQVRDLEDYIDTLLVRIMEQKPTLLQLK